MVIINKNIRLKFCIIMGVLFCLIGFSLTTLWPFFRLSYNSYFYSYFSSYSITLKFDDLINKKVAENITIIINSYKNNALKALSLKDEIEQHYNLIDTLSITYKASRTACVSIRTQKPFSIINNNYIITESGTLCPKNYYSSNALKDVPILWVKNITDISLAEFLEYIKAFSFDIFTSYDVLWISSDEIALRSKYYENVQANIQANIQESIIISDITTINNSNKLNSAQELCKKKYKKIDIRFNNQIVCSRLRGVNYEKVWKELNNSD